MIIESKLEVSDQEFDSELGTVQTVPIPGPKGDPGEKGEKGDKGDKGDPGVVKFTVVKELPEQGTDDAIYLVPVSGGTDSNMYDEYIFVDGVWEKIGSTAVEVDLTDYVKKTDYANYGKRGLVTIFSTYNGLGFGDDGAIAVNPASKAHIDGRNSSCPVTPGNLDYAIKAGLAANKEAWTEEEKAAARELLGIIPTQTQHKTAYGNPLTVSDAANRAVKELTMTLQNDAGFDFAEVSVSGKNLIDKNRYINGMPGQPNFTSFIPASTYGEYRCVYLPLIPGGTYTITQNTIGKYARWGCIDEIPTVAGNIPMYQCPVPTVTTETAGFCGLSASHTTHTFVNRFNRKYLVGIIWCKDDTVSYDEIADTVQVELGTQATELEAYNGSVYTIPIGETVTGGELDVINGVFTKTDGTSISVTPTEVVFPEGNVVVYAVNATTISAKYATSAQESSGGAENPLAGKKIVAIGDSMVYGHTLAADKTWLALIAERNGMTYVNYGSNGRYMTHNPRGDDNRYDGVCDVFQNMDNDADYVLVFAGTNDIQQNFALGNEDSTDTAEFYGALNAITDGLQAKYPTAKIAFITPYARAGLLERSKQFRDAICTACERGGIPVFDNIKNGGINWNVAAQLTAYTLNDTYHLNAAGMDMASRKYEKFLKQI